jgi:hypothetical protein
VCSCIGPHRVCNSVRVHLARTSVARLPPAKLGCLLDDPHRWQSCTEAYAIGAPKVPR